jgi:LmbE family N-acetylglucosaminyl deacetylase
MGNQACISQTMGDWKTELTGRVLVLVAHADDESLAYGGLLQKMREAVVVIATDGAPRDEYFWGRFGSREKYAAVRREEARRAALLAGVRELVLLAEADGRLEGHRFEDQRLFLNLAAAYGRLEALAARVRPEAIATLAYEGGHPDHDSCSLLGARLGERLAVPVWEAPLYSRFQGFRGFKVSEVNSKSKGTVGWGELPLTVAAQKSFATGCAATDAAPAAGAGGRAGGEGELRLQEFLCANGTEALVDMTAEELERKQAMCAQYVSQGTLLRSVDWENVDMESGDRPSLDLGGRDLRDFDPRREVVRPQAKYDYGCPPHPGRTNYECWQWWMSSREVCARFAEFVESGR